MRFWPRSGTFGAVMSFGILSIAFDVLGLATASDVLLALACLAYVSIAACYLAAGRRGIHLLQREMGDGRLAFGHFTLPAASNVLASRLALAHLMVPATVLFGLGIAGWIAVSALLAVGLGIFGPPFRSLTGSSLLLVVATQSVSSTTLLVVGPGAVSAAVAAGMWGLGMGLYTVLVVGLARRYLAKRPSPDDIDPSLGLTMGALAISTLAALILRAAIHPDTGVGARVLLTASLITWSAGGIFMAILVVAWGLKTVLHGLRPVYHPSEWSVVFPLGMFGVAGELLARQSGWALPHAVATLSVTASVAGLAVVLVLALIHAVGRGQGAKAHAVLKGPP